MNVSQRYANVELKSSISKWAKRNWKKNVMGGNNINQNQERIRSNVICEQNSGIRNKRESNFRNQG